MLKIEVLALTGLSIISASLSLVGSSLIIFIILRQRSLHFLRCRLLFTMSLFDIIFDIGLGPYSMLSPPVDDYGYHTFGHGNDRTCAFQGFAVQLGNMAVPGYNAMLCLYYMAIIRYGIDEKTLIEHYELYMHICALMLPLGTAAVAAALNLYESTYAQCWIPFEPSLDSPSSIIQIMTISFVFISGITIVVSMIMTYRSVQESERAMENYQFANSPQASTSSALRNTYNQALLYVLGFTVTYFFAAVQTIYLFILIVLSIGPPDTLPWTPLLFLQTFFFPMQGFFNFLAFVRPRVVNVLKDNSSLTYFAALRKVIVDTTTPAPIVVRALPPRRMVQEPHIFRQSQNFNLSGPISTPEPRETRLRVTNTDSDEIDGDTDEEQPSGERLQETHVSNPITFEDLAAQESLQAQRSPPRRASLPDLFERVQQFGRRLSV